MNIGIAKEGHHLENRVALTPAGAKTLVSAGHTVYLEQGAGEISGFVDEDYLDVGVTLVYSHEEIFLRSKLLLKVAPPKIDECEMMPDEQIVLAAFHLAVAPEESLKLLLQKKITAVGYEIIEDDEGNLPVVVPMSELAGQMSLSIAGYYLSNRGGGRGILLGGAAGIPPATVVILGAGTLGLNAAKTAIGIGANVILFDSDITRLRYANDLFKKQLVTYLPFEYNLERAVPIADVIIGAVSIHGEMAPKLITKEMVRSMKPRSIMVDAAIDSGGCFETSHPTNWADATYVTDDITHFCVPNMPSNISRTATYALSNAILPYAYRIAEVGFDESIKQDYGLARGIYTYQGDPLRNVVAGRLGLKAKPLKDVIKSGGSQ
ncbi:MAG: alanine dehydrogenase [candidate division Zixibacteria bacterium]|nr:alanine dehydrogenase [candidate division Zixibacteria bacterium]